MTSRFDDRAKQRVDELIDLGEQVKASLRRTPAGSVPNPGLFSQWTTSSLNFLSVALGEDSAHYQTFARVEQSKQSWVSKVDPYLGVLRAAKDDIESGWVGRRDLLVTANAFGGFLEQAEYLLEERYKDAAAVLAGGVLESTLRTMCERHGVEIGPREKIGTLNDKLAKKLKPPAYSSMQHKQIITWAELRDNAAHAHYDRYSEQDVADMLKWLRAFAARHLA